MDYVIRHQLRNKNVYEINMHRTYNFILVQTNEQLQEKAESNSTFQTVNTGRDHIGYLIILKKLCL